MIVMPKERIVFIQVVAAAGGSLSLACLAQPNAFYILPNHDPDVPAKYQSYDISIIIRNPLHRVVSLWRRIGCNTLNRLKRAQSFPEFVTRFDDNCGPYAPMSLCEYVDRSKANMLLRFEELPRCLSTLRFTQRTIVTHRHKSMHPVPEIPRNTIDLIAARYLDDFQRFGYEPCMS